MSKVLVVVICIWKNETKGESYMTPTVLVIEDEVKILDMISNYLTKENFHVLKALDGKLGLEIAFSAKPDLIVLDLMLPEMSGLEVCREVRKSHKTPIIMLTAKSQEVDKLVGLEMGADDYITKPFSLAELTARIRAVLRRTQPESGDKQHILARGNLRLDLDKCELYKDNDLISLTPTEMKILGVLMNSPGRVYSRLQLLDLALNDAYAGYERSIDTHISNLRKKIEDNPADPDYILTVFGIGYKFKEA